MRSGLLLFFAWVLPAEASMVVMVGVDGTEVSESDVLGRIDRALEDRFGPEQIRRGSTGDLIARCGLGETCLAENLSGIADTGLFASVNLELDPMLVTVMLLDVPAGRATARAIETIDSSAKGTVLGALDRAIERVLEDARYPLAGRVQLEIAPPEAILRLLDANGAPVEPASKLPPGAYRLVAEAEGYLIGETRFRVEPRKDHRIYLALQPEPLYTSPWLWTGVAAGVVAASVAIGLAVHFSGSSGDCVCFAYTQGACMDNVCD